MQCYLWTSLFSEFNTVECSTVALLYGAAAITHSSYYNIITEILDCERSEEVSVSLFAQRR